MTSYCKTCKFRHTESPRVYCHKRSPQSDYKWPRIRHSSWCGEYDPGCIHENSGYVFDGIECEHLRQGHCYLIKKTCTMTRVKVRGIEE